MQLLLNPRKRARKSRKTRSPAQRAATRKMLAANRSRRGSSTRRRRTVVHANPVRHARRRRSYRRNPIGSRARRAYSGLRASGAMSLLKQGAFAGVGAVAVDLLFGQLTRFLPASLAVPVDPTTNTTNWGYFATKAAVALGIGTYGRKFLPARLAEAAAVGSISILVYQVARSMVPSSLTLGAYVNPGRVMQPRVGMGAYHALPGATRGGGNVSAMGARAAMGVRR